MSIFLVSVRSGVAIRRNMNKTERADGVVHEKAQLRDAARVLLGGTSDGLREGTASHTPRSSRASPGSRPSDGSPEGTARTPRRSPAHRPTSVATEMARERILQVESVAARNRRGR